MSTAAVKALYTFVLVPLGEHGSGKALNIGEAFWHSPRLDSAVGRPGRMCSGRNGKWRKVAMFKKEMVNRLRDFQ
jgi:hypothetical protein